MNIISESTQYWVIRSGIEAKCFEQFYRDGCVALGWDKVGKSILNENSVSLDYVKDVVAREYGEVLYERLNSKAINRKIGDIASKIYKFVHEVQVGDIVLTPGDRDVLIGTVTGELILTEGRYNTEPSNLDEKFIGQLNKIRTVRWMERIDKNKLEPNIRLCLRVIHGISQITQEQVITEINRTLYSMYEFGNKTHSIYRIRNEKEVEFKKYAKFIECINKVYDVFGTDDERLVIKTNVQSPGPIELIGNKELISKIVAAVAFLLKNDLSGLDKLEGNKEKIQEIKEKKYDDVADEEYADYDFPMIGTF